MLIIWNKNNYETIIKLKSSSRGKDYVKRFMDDAEALAKCLKTNLPDSTLIRLAQILKDVLPK